jgi:hypothetical protein
LHQIHATPLALSLKAQELVCVFEPIGKISTREE